MTPKPRPSQTKQPGDTASDAAGSVAGDGSPTPEERLAETLADDAEVGSDGTGMGELP
jgi:hypothetical protein